MAAHPPKLPMVVGEPPRPREAAIDTSPIVYLSRVGRLDLLSLVADRIVIVEDVYAELGRGDAAARQTAAVDAADWIERLPSPPVPPVVASHGLDAGESATIAYALVRPGTVIVVDEFAGRRLAVGLGVSIKGTLGVVILARQTGTIPLARPLLEAMRREGMYLKPATMDAALQLVDE